MKTYILKYDVYNNIDFPAGTVVEITDDYWGKNGNDKNTGFTVVQGKLKGKKGCVANGLNGCLLDNTPANKKAIREYNKAIKELEQSIKNIDKKFNSLPTVKL